MEGNYIIIFEVAWQ